MDNFLTRDAIRTLFSQAMSAMYQQEVPQYGTLTQSWLPPLTNAP
ncbi:hypothetical protein E05_16800 [Plautia stali symbiont]|nr:hypothetical protein E05_16800 [Plautia stali symbiont]